MNLRTTFRPFFLTRHGQSEYNVSGKIGGDSGLSGDGLAYAHALADFVDEKVIKDCDGNPIPGRLWTSSLQRTIQTAQFIKQEKILIRDEISDQMAEWVQMRPRYPSSLFPPAVLPPSISIFVIFALYVRTHKRIEFLFFFFHFSYFYYLKCIIKMKGPGII